MSELIIKSIENETFKLFRKLFTNKTFRRELLQSLLDGPHLIKACIDSGGKILEFIKDASIESDEINLIIKDNPNVKIHIMQHDLFTKTKSQLYKHKRCPEGYKLSLIMIFFHNCFLVLRLG